MKKTIKMDKAILITYDKEDSVNEAKGYQVEVATIAGVKSRGVQADEKIPVLGAKPASLEIL